VKDWLWNREGVEKNLYFQLFASFLTIDEKLFSNAMVFWLNSCLSHIVFTIECKINIVVGIRACYQTSTNEVFLNKGIFSIKYHLFWLPVISSGICPCFLLAGGLCKFYAYAGEKLPMQRQLLLVQCKQQAKPFLSMNNYSPLVISRNEKISN
jgi:hypothetical protein